VNVDNEYRGTKTGSVVDLDPHYRPERRPWEPARAPNGF
jgi:hypothetical protein